MPNRQEIRRLAEKHSPFGVLGECLRKLHCVTGRRIILYAANFITPAVAVPGESVIINGEDIQHLMTAISEMKKGGAREAHKLDLILHSPGGSLAAAEQIVNYLRAKYSHIRVIVPQNAMSAATMIACAADEIVMGRHSALGPTDPQMIFGGHQFPAQSVLNEFRLAQESDGIALAILTQKIKEWPPGLIDECAKVVELSKTVVADWLHCYMKLSRKAAENAAQKLADTGENFIHDRPFNIDKLQSWGLKIKPLESNQQLQDAVLSVFHAATAVFEMGGAFKVVVNHSGIGVFQRVAAED